MKRSLMKMKNNERHYALITLKGRILWSNKYKQKNDKFVHAYLVSVEEEYEGKEFKHVFSMKKFNCDSDDALYIKGDEIRATGFLKVSSYKNKEDEWVNDVYIQINGISLDLD